MSSHPSPEPIDQAQILGARGGVVSSQGQWRGRAVFVKTLISAEPQLQARFQHEGDVAATLHHPQVAQLLYRTSTQLIFAHIPGGTLRDQVEQGPLDAEASTQVVWGLLQALDYLHAQGVTHHDLKPENVMLHAGALHSQAVRVVDFGMCHAQNCPLDIHSGTRLGTPHFMAPEQFQGQRGDPRSDLYSVGVLLFDCLAGHPPYEDALGWLAGIQTQRAALPGPAALHPLMQAALQREPQQRPQNAAQMLVELAEVRARLGLAPL